MYSESQFQCVAYLSVCTQRERSTNEVVDVGPCHLLEGMPVDTTPVRIAGILRDETKTEGEFGADASPATMLKVAKALATNFGWTIKVSALGAT